MPGVWIDRPARFVLQFHLQLVRAADCHGLTRPDLSIVGNRDTDGISCKDRHRGFPHVYFFEIEPVHPRRCRLILRVGRWTATRIPRPLVRLWLAWVFTKTCLSVRNSLLQVALNKA